MKPSPLSIFISVSALAVVLGVPVAAQARGVRIGVEAAVFDEAFGVGAFGAVGLARIAGHQLSGRLGVDYFFPGDNIKYYEINGDLLLALSSGHPVDPYLGGGFNYGRRKWHDQVLCESLSGTACEYTQNSNGPNVLAGLGLGRSRWKPFVEVKVELRDGGKVFAKGGIHF